jgi:hypothetical protein
MGLKKVILSLSIATALTLSALVVPSISVYAGTIPTNTTVSTQSSTSSSINLPIGLTEYIYDSVHQEYVGIGNGYSINNYGEEDTSFYIGYIYTSRDGINWTKKASPSVYNVYGIATDGKGNIGTNYGKTPSMYLTNCIYRSNDGGLTWNANSSGDGYRLENDNTPDGTPDVVYSGTYIGMVQSVSYSNGKFTVIGTWGTLYSLDGYNWKR